MNLPTVDLCATRTASFQLNIMHTFKWTWMVQPGCVLTFECVTAEVDITPLTEGSDFLTAPKKTSK